MCIICASKQETSLSHSHKKELCDIPRFRPEDFEILSHLGDGGYGSVFKARCVAGEHLMALKFFGYIKKGSKPRVVSGLHSGAHESETCFPSEQKSSSSTWSVAGALADEPEVNQSAASSADFLKDTKRDTKSSNDKTKNWGNSGTLCHCLFWLRS